MLASYTSTICADFSHLQREGNAPPSIVAALDQRVDAGYDEEIGKDSAASVFLGTYSDATWKTSDILIVLLPQVHQIQ